MQQGRQDRLEENTPTEVTASSTLGERLAYDRCQLVFADLVLGKQILSILLLELRLELPAHIPDKFRIAWALLRLTFDHASSITSNFFHHGIELAGSPFALLRPMNEALKRGAWFAFCATDEETVDFIQHDRVPQRNLSEQIEAHSPFDRFPIFTNQYQNAWRKFHSFTHGGSQIVGAYSAGHGIGPAFPEADVYAVLDHVEGIAVTGVHVMCMIAGEFEPELATAALEELERISTAAERMGLRTHSLA